MSSDGERRQIKVKTRLLVVAALLVAGTLSWSELLEDTGLSKNTLSATLKDLKADGDLSLVASNSEDEIKPSISYDLSESARKKYGKVTEALANLRLVEKLANQITENIRQASPKDRAGRKKLFAVFYDCMRKASLAALETSLLTWGEFEPPLDEVVASISLTIAKRILLPEDLPSEMTDGIRKDLEEDRRRLIESLESETLRLGKKLAQNENKK